MNHRAQPTAFEPDQFKEFAITRSEWLTARHLELHYVLGDDVAFVERYEFDVPEHLVKFTPADEAVARFTDLLHLTASMSYYKAALPPRISVRTGLEPEAAAMLLGDLVEFGLAEMRLTANVERDVVRPAVRATSPAHRIVRRPNAEPSPLAVVPIGGGKDSLVALDLVVRSGRVPILVAVNTFGDPLGSLGLHQTHSVVKVQRTIDPLLLRLNDEGALNGHVPITAVISAVALVVAAMVGATEVAMSNERDASLPTRTVHGREINHQYSKSWDFERMLAGVVAREVADVSIFSLLRPVSEATIFERFATMPQYLPRISSCNRVRTKGGGSSEGTRWCGSCPKCLYSFLGFAAFTRAERVLPVFGGYNLLDQDRFLEPYMDILQIGEGGRPFECLGVPEDARYLMSLCCDSQDWSNSRVCAALGPRLGPVLVPWVGGPNLVPDSLWPSLRELQPIFDRSEGHPTRQLTGR